MKWILEMEEAGWRALSSDRSAARNFYRSVLHEDAIMLFAGGIRLNGAEAIMASLAGQPWKHFHIEDPKLLQVAEAVWVVTYKVTAQRDGGPPYEALVGSTYASVDGAWKLAVHQHTPI